MAIFKMSRASRPREKFIPVRPLVAGIIVLLLANIAGTPANVWAQKSRKTKTKKPVVENRRLLTRDEWPIVISYYPSTAKDPKESPVVILLHRLHRELGDRLVWKNGFAASLQKEGYAAIAVDLRKHGESDPDMQSKGRSSRRTGLKRTDMSRMITDDLEAVKEFIYREHQEKRLNMRKTAIVAPEKSAPIAINFAWNDWLKPPFDDADALDKLTPRGQDVRALILLSPNERLPGIRTSNALKDLAIPGWGVSFLICFGNKDTLDKGASQKIHKKISFTKKNKDRMYLKEFKDLKLRGTDLLGRKNRLVEETMLDFLHKHLKRLPDVWENRKNRIVR